MSQKTNKLCNAATPQRTRSTQAAGVSWRTGDDGYDGSYLQGCDETFAAVDVDAFGTEVDYDDGLDDDQDNDPKDQG
jgi:hypothetical protein